MLQPKGVISPVFSTQNPAHNPRGSKVKRMSQRPKSAMRQRVSGNAFMKQ